MSSEVESNDSNKNAPVVPVEEIKFTERMRKATRKEHRISDALINAKMTIGNKYRFNSIDLRINCFYHYYIF